MKKTQDNSHVPSGYYRVELMDELSVTIRRLPASEEDVAYKVPHKAPENWVIGCIVESRPKPGGGLDGRGCEIRRWECW